MSRRRPLAGSHPEEQYAPATRQKVFLDRPTSHGGWPEGEYDPPVRDRIYSWYKKMKMMPESDEEYIADGDLSMRERAANAGQFIREADDDLTLFGKSSEQMRDTQKQRYGHRAGYVFDDKQSSLAERLAAEIARSDSPETSRAFLYVVKNPQIAKNVWSNLQNEGHFDLAKMVDAVVDEYVAQRGKGMRITESMLRRIIREEYSRLNEANDEAVKHCKTYLKSKRTKSDLSALAGDLKKIEVTEMTEISAALEAANSQMPKNSDEFFSDQGFDGIASDIVRLQKSMKESQRGSDENGQHDNDTDASDPQDKNLREARRIALRRAIMAELHRRTSR